MSRKTATIALISFVLLTYVAGCGDKKATETVEKFPEAMRLLVGKWQGRVRVEKKEKARKEFGDPVVEALQTMKMEVVFRDDGKMSTKADVVASNHSAHREGTAKWEVISHEGDTVKIQSVDDNTKRKEIVSITFSGTTAFSIPYKGIGFVELQRVEQTARK